MQDDKCRALNLDTQIESEAEARVIANDFAERHELDIVTVQNRASGWFKVGNLQKNFHPGMTVEALLTRLSTEYLPPASERLIELGIAVYQVDKVHGDDLTIPASDMGKWFVSALAGSPFAKTVHQIPLADTEREAWKLAAQHYLPRG
ncbi:hypothetical protein [Herbaspirillum huttiense]|uniref:hypothetical protein n=1 Tax=Herbaspirillum huttiense TaxID=863372 RepID=UPI002176B3EE|nr:hypothetical protein [Herbaspirillum huttiense]UWE19385.1 hypothetical protein NY669_26785 [Herbaspirillum huttiense]